MEYSPSGRYVALLRGVNVGGHGKIAMAELRALFATVGLRDAKTLIQSGNVVFRCDDPPTEATIEEAIVERFGVSARVTLRSAEKLSLVIEACPFDETLRTHLHVAFCVAATANEAASMLELARFVPETIVISGSEIYMCLPNGMGRSKLVSYLDRRLGVAMTIRNWNTVLRLRDLLI